MSYTDFRNIRAEVSEPDRRGQARVAVYAEVSSSGTVPRDWKEHCIDSALLWMDWRQLPERLYPMANDAAGGSIKLNGRTVSGSQFLAAFERAVYPKKPKA